MPSQRVAVGGANLLQHGGGKFSYCTPQLAHCRSEYAMTDMESWFPANGLSEITSSPAVSSHSLQLLRPSEKPLATSCIADDEVASATGFFQGEYQADRWWPTTINAHAAKDNYQSSPQHGISDSKPAESWCSPVDVAAGVDLNTPSSCERTLPSALRAVVSVAPAAGVLVATKRNKGKSVSAPTSPGGSKEVVDGSTHLGVHKSKWNGKRPVSQRENHIWSERQRRKGMNYLFSTLRSLLPHPTSKTDKSTVVGEIIKYIQSLQVKLDILTKKRQHVIAARTLSTFHGSGSLESSSTPPSKAFVSNGLTLVDHSSDPSCMTAITALPLPGSESGLHSYLGSNVGLHVCGLNVFITASSPRGRRGLLQQLLLTIHKHDLDVINANISTSNASIFHCLHCQASPDAELLNNSLHSDLQSMITNFETPF